MSDEALCKFDDLADGQAIGLVGRVREKQRNMLIVRKGGRAYAYINICPHAGQLLDMVPGKFFGPDPDLLRCTTHGALFRIEDGICVRGPCKGEGLQPVATEIRGGEIFVKD